MRVRVFSCVSVCEKERMYMRACVGVRAYGTIRALYSHVRQSNYCIVNWAIEALASLHNELEY